MTLRYLTDVFTDVVFHRNNVVRRNGLAPGQGADGYGRKITTDYVAQINGRTYRVYAICFSNAASHYVTYKGEKLFLKDSDISEQVRYP